MGEATTAFEKLPLEQDLHLLRSVVYAGVWQKYYAPKTTRRSAVEEHERHDR